MAELRGLALVGRVAVLNVEVAELLGLAGRVEVALAAAPRLGPRIERDHDADLAGAEVRASR